MKENRKKRHPRKVSVFLRVLTTECPDVFLKPLMLILKEISVGTLKT
jgi:hypothetical protein